MRHGAKTPPRLLSARSSGRVATRRRRMRSIVTHWRTSIASGQAAVHWPLPLQASTQRAASPASPAPCVQRDEARGDVGIP